MENRKRGKFYFLLPRFFRFKFIKQLPLKFEYYW